MAAVDGIEICSSFARFCDHCMERKVTHLVEGEPREEMQYDHRICAVTVVSSAFPIPLGIRFQKNGEDEVACSLDYLQAPFVKAIEGLGYHSEKESAGIAGGI